MKGEIWGDASAALGIIHRRGLGRTRRIDIGHAWIQEMAAKDRLKFKNVLGKDNLADFIQNMWTREPPIATSKV